MASVAKREWTSPKGEKREAYAVRWQEAGQHKSKGGFRLKKAAQEFARNVETRLATGGGTLPLRGMTVRKIADLFLKHQEDRLRDGRISKGTYRALHSAVCVSIISRLGERVFADLTPVDIDAFYSSLMRGDPVRLRRRVEGGGRLSPQTAVDRVACLSKIARFAIKRRYLDADPVAEPMKELRRVKRVTIRTFDVESVGLVLRAAEARGWHCQDRTAARMKIMVHLAAFSGLRVGEILGLPLSRIRLDRRTIEIRQAMTPYGEIKGPKTAAGNRDVPIPLHVVPMLKEWLEKYYSKNKQEIVFAQKDGSFWYHNGFRTCWYRLLKRAGLWVEGFPSKQMHFHALRHFAASWMIENGQSIMDTASLLGHSKFDVTLQVYCHPVVGGHRRFEVMDRMSERLLALPPTIMIEGGTA